MRYARLGPSSVLVRVLITKLGYPVEVLHHLLGAKGEQHVLAAASSKQQQQQQQAEGRKVLVITAWLKTGIQVAQNDRRAKAHHHKPVSLHFEPSSPFYGRFSVQKWVFLGCFRLFSGRSS